jgi:hypothetical protein
MIGWRMQDVRIMMQLVIYVKRSPKRLNDAYAALRTF